MESVSGGDKHDGYVSDRFESDGWTPAQILLHRRFACSRLGPEDMGVAARGASTQRKMRQHNEEGLRTRSESCRKSDEGSHNPRKNYFGSRGLPGGVNLGWVA